MYSVPHLKNGIFSMPEKKPTRTTDLDYFYGQSSELFSFYRIPKLLFQDSRFQPLSTDAKTLYGILLDRMSLSARNGWLDKAGRVFIIYTVQEVQDSLGCADKKATKLLRELEEYGLIERKRRGLGKPDLIYVKNFSSESSKTPYLNRDNDDSGTVQNTLQDPAKLRCNKTERNNTEVSDTDPIYSDENDWMSKRAQLEEYFSQSLEIDLLLRLCPDDEDAIYQIVDLLVDRTPALPTASCCALPGTVLLFMPEIFNGTNRIIGRVPWRKNTRPKLFRYYWMLQTGRWSKKR